MNEFTRMIREALVGDDDHGSAIDATEIRVALDRIDARDRLVRWMGWFTVTFWGAVTGVCIWRFFDAPADDTRALVGWAALGIGAFGGIAFGKMFIFLMQAHLGLLRDMKRVELRIVETTRSS